MATPEKYDVDTARLLKLSQADLELFQSASSAKGKTLSGWLRDVCRRSAKKTLEKSSGKS